jgi:hypothetical protein
MDPQTDFSATREGEALWANRCRDIRKGHCFEGDLRGGWRKFCAFSTAVHRTDEAKPVLCPKRGAAWVVDLLWLRGEIGGIRTTRTLNAERGRDVPQGLDVRRKRRCSA